MTFGEIYGLLFNKNNISLPFEQKKVLEIHHCLYLCWLLVDLLSDSFYLLERWLLDNLFASAMVFAYLSHQGTFAVPSFHTLLDQSFPDTKMQTVSHWPSEF